MKYLLYLLLTIFSFDSIDCYSQDNSILFNNDRKLISDTSISLDIEQFHIWNNIEEDLLSNFFNQFNTPQFFLDVGRSYSWIFSFQFDTIKNKFYNVKIHKSLHHKSIRDLKAQKQVIIDSVQAALNQCKYGSILSKLKNNKSNFTYYIPIILDVKKVDKFINKNGILQLESASPAFAQPDKKVH